MIATLTYLGYVLQNLEKYYFLIVYIVCVMNGNNCHSAYITCYAMLIRVHDVLFFELLNFFTCSLYSDKCENITGFLRVITCEWEDVVTSVCFVGTILVRCYINCHNYQHTKAASGAEPQPYICVCNYIITIEDSKESIIKFCVMRKNYIC